MEKQTTNVITYRCTGNLIQVQYVHVKMVIFFAPKRYRIPYGKTLLKEYWMMCISVDFSALNLSLKTPKSPHRRDSRKNSESESFTEKNNNHSERQCIKHASLKSRSQNMWVVAEGFIVTCNEDLAQEKGEFELKKETCTVCILIWFYNPTFLSWAGTVKMP